MATPVASHLDELALQTKIDDYGDFDIVTIPNCENLTVSERWVITVKARQLQSANALNAERLQEALRDVTPPLDEEEELEDSRKREVQARRDLEAEGCPPCYPADVDVAMLRDPPEEYRPIVGYWLSFPETSGIPLSAQLRAWRYFRTYQQQTRRREFTEFAIELRQRRERHGLGSPTTLTADLEQQSPLERWLEYQNYQLARLEAMERKRDGLKKQLTELHEPDDIDAVTQCVGRSDQTIDRHMILLEWIEQQRRALDTGGDAIAPRNGADVVLRRASARARQKREKTPPAVLDQRARVTKPKEPYKRKAQHQIESEQMVPEPKTVATKRSDVVAPKSPIRSKPKTRSTNKTIRAGHSLAEPAIARQLGARKVQKVTKGQPWFRGLAPVNRLETVTRSGRKSIPPERWAPG